MTIAASASSTSEAALQQAANNLTAISGFSGASEASRQEMEATSRVDLVRAIVFELAAFRAEQIEIFEVRYTGSGNMTAASQTAELPATVAGGQFKPVYVRCHFTGGAGTAAMTIGIDHQAGSPYDATLWTTPPVGTGTDLFLRFGKDEASGPSPWTLQYGDKLTFAWTNPGGETWGLSIGLARA